MLAVARRRSGANSQMPSGRAMTIANSSATTSGKSRMPSRCPPPKITAGQHDDQQQAGQRVDQHVERPGGIRAESVRHGPSLPTARIFNEGGFCVRILLLVVILAGLAYGAGGWCAPTANRPKTRTIGPDDDPDFLRRLGHGDNADPR